MTELNIKIFDRDARGHTKIGWLDSRHTFSFGRWFSPDALGHGPLRVINDDRVIPGAGFGTHPHQDMEILTYVLDGELAHKDSMGNGSVIRPGDVQRMSAGTGVTHSEFNNSQENGVHFLQIWVVPEAEGLKPGYEQKHYGQDEKAGRFKLVASRQGRDGSVSLNQDVDIYAAHLDDSDAVSHSFANDRYGWLHLAKGEATLNGERIKAGDGARISGQGTVTLTHAQDAEVLLFDMVS